MITRKDVAEVAGVSPTTVSFVLNNSRKISEKTRKKVFDAVEKLNYKPDMIARSMVTNETKQLGMVLDDIMNPFYGEIVAGFENAAIEQGYFVNICTGLKNLDGYFDNFISRRLDGLFIVSLPYKFHMEKVYELVDNGVKVVTSGSVEADIKKVSIIDSNYEEAMGKAIDYLFRLGHRDIAYLSGLSRNLKYDSRAAKYLDSIKEYGLDYGDDLFINGEAPYETSIESGYKLAKKLVQSQRKFSAVICLNDLMAVGAIRALKEAGLRIPHDVSVMGFDNIVYSSYTEPPITTISFDKYSFGARAFDLLYTNIKKGNTGFLKTEFELIARESTVKVLTPL